MKDPIRLLEKAIEAQRCRMRGYEVISEALTFETLRAIDFAYCRELYPELKNAKHDDVLPEPIRRRGVNNALRRVMPISLQNSGSKLFRSNKKTAEQADEFLFDAGTLDLAERQLRLVRAGVLEAQISPETVMGLPVIILSVLDVTAYHEQVGYQGLNWLSEQVTQLDRGWEENLENRHREMLPHIVEHLRRLRLDADSPVKDIDNYFQEWASLYLRRMAFADLLASEDRIGGKRYSDYVTVLLALSTLSAQRLCYAGLINADDPRTGRRNLITGGANYVELVEAVANHLDATTEEIMLLLEYLSLTPKNMKSHLERGTPTFAPIVRMNEHFCALPSYGLEMNPYVFLFNELRVQHEHDWFQLVNNREPRWIQELLSLFVQPRWSCRDGVELKRNGKAVTDIDFTAYDHVTQSLLLFQLKWQQAPVGDERVRRNNASNLVSACNKWTEDIYNWIYAEGLASLMVRLGLKNHTAASFHTVVLGRYGAHFTGHANLDRRAAWSDWGNFLRLFQEVPDCSPRELIDGLRAMLERATSEVRPEMTHLLLPGLVLIEQRQNE